MRNSPLRIAAGQGFWGDDPDAPVRQVEEGPIDYLMMDYLAEVTMSIMQKQRDRDPSAGYARDFIPLMKRILPKVMEGGIRVATNAGGVNPVGCAEALLEAADRAGVRRKLRVLAQGAQVVLTGRTADAALTYAPMIHEFGWPLDDVDRLAAGVVAGHINECGAQASGGNPLLKEALTAERVKEHFGEMVKGRVERFELANLHALNFLLHDALEGGGTVSLMTDAQAKVTATAILRMEVDVPQEVAEEVGP